MRGSMRARHRPSPCHARLSFAWASRPGGVCGARDGAERAISTADLGCPRPHPYTVRAARLSGQAFKETIMAYTLPELPYAYDALEPHIDTETMKIHHTKHHQTYINNVNAALEGTEYADLPVEELVKKTKSLPENLQGVVRNNGGGHANHSLFWTVMAPNAGGAPKGDVAKAIEQELGGFEKFKEAFTKAALTRFGSGWAWLSVTPDKKV